jgi:hypothetical protein
MCGRKCLYTFGDSLVTQSPTLKWLHLRVLSINRLANTLANHRRTEPKSVHGSPLSDIKGTVHMTLKFYRRRHKGSVLWACPYPLNLTTLTHNLIYFSDKHSGLHKKLSLSIKFPNKKYLLNIIKPNTCYVSHPSESLFNDDENKIKMPIALATLCKARTTWIVQIPGLQIRTPPETRMYERVFMLWCPI